MGNQRDVRQLEPFERPGVAIRIHDGSEGDVQRILSVHEDGHFYTYFGPANDERTIYNMDGDDTDLGPTWAVSDIQRLSFKAAAKCGVGTTPFANISLP